MIQLSDIGIPGLQRPEYVLTHESGLLPAADRVGDGGVAVADARDEGRGRVSRIAARGGRRAIRPTKNIGNPGDAS